MNINNISLQNFRNYSRKEFEFERYNVIVGDNGVGKSNLLEAIYLMVTGKSFRADYDTEMTSYNNQYSIINVQCPELELKITISDRKKLEVNGVPRRQMDFVGNLRAVLFAPQDMDLVTGSPGIRRRYLDFIISQTDREYRRCLVSYEKGLRQRNKLLSLIRDNFATRSQLFFWDKLLIKNGEYLTVRRGEYLQSLVGDYTTLYDKSIISESRLAQYEMEEVASAATLVGPHRDDFKILLEERDVAKFGSRGQQRMAVLWLKQGEIRYLGGEPILLLDDIFSELDHKHREEVMRLIGDYPGQVIATTADEHLLPDLANAKIIRL